MSDEEKVNNLIANIIGAVIKNITNTSSIKNASILSRFLDKLRTNNNTSISEASTDAIDVLINEPEMLKQNDIGFLKSFFLSIARLLGLNEENKYETGTGDNNDETIVDLTTDVLSKPNNENLIDLVMQLLKEKSTDDNHVKDEENGNNMVDLTMQVLNKPNNENLIDLVMQIVEKNKSELPPPGELPPISGEVPPISGEHDIVRLNRLRIIEEEFYNLLYSFQTNTYERDVNELFSILRRMFALMLEYINILDRMEMHYSVDELNLLIKNFYDSSLVFLKRKLPTLSMPENKGIILELSNIIRNFFKNDSVDIEEHSYLKDSSFFELDDFDAKNNAICLDALSKSTVENDIKQKLTLVGKTQDKCMFTYKNEADKLQTIVDVPIPII